MREHFTDVEAKLLIGSIWRNNQDYANVPAGTTGTVSSLYVVSGDSRRIEGYRFLFGINIRWERHEGDSLEDEFSRKDLLMELADGRPAMEPISENAKRFIAQCLVTGNRVKQNAPVRPTTPDPYEGLVEKEPSTKCHRCNRKLTHPDSVDRGYGSFCWRKMGLAALRQKKIEERQKEDEENATTATTEA